MALFDLRKLDPYCLSPWIGVPIRIFLRFITGMSYLERTCSLYQDQSGSWLVCEVNKILLKSKHPSLKLILENDDPSKYKTLLCEVLNSKHYHNTQEKVDEILDGILSLKDVSQEAHSSDDVAFINPGDRLKVFATSLSYVLTINTRYNLMINAIEFESKAQYDLNNQTHVKMMYDIFKSLLPDSQLPELCDPLWMKIGFQCSHPEKDFRGLGLFSLKLIHFISCPNKYVSPNIKCDKKLQKYFPTDQEILRSEFEDITIVRNVFQEVSHGSYEYFWAIGIINIGFDICNLLKQRKFISHFINTGQLNGDTVDLDFVKHLVRVAFFRFHSYWIAKKPVNVMAFNVVKDSFFKEIEIGLNNFDFVLN